MRHQFDSTATSPEDMDYFNYTQPSPHPMSSSDNSASSSSASGNKSKSKGGRVGSRHMVQAGDLHMPLHAPVFSRTESIAATPKIPRPSGDNNAGGGQRMAHGANRRWTAEDFDLREEVMSCIAKSIGLLQPPISGPDSPNASPRLFPADGTPLEDRSFDSPYSSLSLLELRDDVSSVTASSTAVSSASVGNNLTGLDNEVEILFFPAGSTLAKAGERNTGEFAA
jgi:lysophospholipid hydrolase